MESIRDNYENVQIYICIHIYLKLSRSFLLYKKYIQIEKNIV